MVPQAGHPTLAGVLMMEIGFLTIEMDNNRIVKFRDTIGISPKCGIDAKITNIFRYCSQECNPDAEEWPPCPSDDDVYCHGCRKFLWAGRE